MANPSGLLTGATGAQGGAAAKALVEGGFAVRALVRDPGSEAASTLADNGCELRRGDFEDADSLTRALIGADGVFPFNCRPLRSIRSARFERAARSSRPRGRPRRVHRPYVRGTRG